MPRSDNFEDTIQVLAPTGGVVAGTMYRINGRLCMAMTSADAGDNFTAKITGRISGAPKYGATGQAMASLSRPYWDATNKRFTASSTGNKDHGVIVAEAATATATTVDVILTGGYAA